MAKLTDHILNIAKRADALLRKEGEAASGPVAGDVHVPSTAWGVKRPKKKKKPAPATAK